MFFLHGQAKLVQQQFTMPLNNNSDVCFRIITCAANYKCAYSDWCSRIKIHVSFSLRHEYYYIHGSIPWEIYCHQMNFRFWNHNRFETGVIDFVGHELPAAFTLFPDTTNWHHGVLWQLNNHTTHKSYLMLSKRLYVFGSCKPSE